MTHCTLHSPITNTTVTYSWSSGGGYDAVGFLEDGSRRQLVDEVHNPRSLFAAASWIVELAELGSTDELGDVLGRIYLGETLDEIGSETAGEIAKVIFDLKELCQ